MVQNVLSSVEFQDIDLALAYLECLWPVVWRVLLLPVLFSDINSWETKHFPILMKIYTLANAPAAGFLSAQALRAAQLIVSNKPDRGLFEVEPVECYDIAVNVTWHAIVMPALMIYCIALRRVGPNMTRRLLIIFAAFTIWGSCFVVWLWTGEIHTRMRTSLGFAVFRSITWWVTAWDEQILLITRSLWSMLKRHRHSIVMHCSIEI